MDPLSALGVASNILAVIDFAWTVLTEARTIHHSSSGLNGEAEFVDRLIEDVVKLDEDVPSLVGVSEELQILLAESKNITALLQKALQSLKGRGNRSKWRSFLSALKHTWGKDRVQELTNKLGSLQAQVTRHIQVATHKEVTAGVTAISHAIAQIDATNIRLDIKIREDFHELQANLLQAIEEATRSGRDIATSINGLLDQNDTHGSNRSEALTKLADIRNLEAATREISQSFDTARTRVDKEILDQLYFSAYPARHRKIEDAHANTFQWALEQQSGETRLREWLESGNVPLRQQRHVELSWKMGWKKKLIMAKFYFWIAGSALQKSQEGLLRSLLFEILRECPELMPVVRSAISALPDRDQPDALQHIQNLLILYQRIVTQEIPLKFCFFVDGLDEFQEQGRDHSDLIKILKQLELSSDVKMCVSSRPWTVFVDTFGSSPKWTLKLEDLTRDDIRRYVSDKINEHPQFNTLTRMNTEYRQVVDAVVHRAQGVFLWVYLVVRKLLEGLTYHDSVSTLYQRLQEFPLDLESFFQHLIDSIEPIYRRYMVRYFKIATISHEPLLAMVYSYLDDFDENPAFAMTIAQSDLDSEQTRLRQDQLRRRLDGRSRGLLELVSCQHGGLSEEFFAYRVDFIHRTVRDFLHQSADIQSLLQHKTGSESFLLGTCHAILAVVKTCGPDTITGDFCYLIGVVYDLFFFTFEFLAENPGSEAAVEPILEAAETSYRSKSSQTRVRYEPFLFIGLAARIEFFAYVQKKLAANPNMLQEARGRDSGTRSRPALDFALDQDHFYGHPIERFAHPIPTRTITQLLEAGADPNESCKHKTVWRRFLEPQHKPWTSDKERMLELLRVLLLHGADLNEPVSPRHSYHNGGLDGKLVTAETLVNELLTPQVANQLYQEVRQTSDQTKARRSIRNPKPKGRWYQNIFRRSHDVNRKTTGVLD
ncbi:hypothetical protein PG997_015383 [Apiospora hydei]|uniref:NACHT domain-containing protein n=1 Tax=Apiospora hydei TaxID=1337664 RepID=A0ABR1UR59_9PEZI